MPGIKRVGWKPLTPFRMVRWAAVAALVASGAARADEAAPVHVDKVRIMAMTRTVPAIGRLVALQSGDVAARIAGSVAEVLVQPGDQVRAGQIIARFDKDKLQAELQLAESELRVAEAEHATAQAEAAIAAQTVTRLEGLRRSAAFNQANYEDAVFRLRAAEAKVKSAEGSIAVKRAALRRSRLDLDYADIRAPYDSVVLRRLTEAGAYLTIGEPIVRLIGSGALEIEVDVPASRLAGLYPGTAVDFRLDDGSRHRAHVRALLPAESPLTRTRAVRLSPVFSAPQDRLAEGQTATVQVPIGTPRQVLTVHKDAVLKQLGNSIVYVVNDKAAHPRPVELGEAIDNRFEVLSGLTEGELAVIRGNERLQPGAPVRIEEGSS